MATIDTAGIVLLVIAGMILLIGLWFLYRYRRGLPADYPRYKSPGEIKTIYDREIRHQKSLVRKAEIEERNRAAESRQKEFARSLAETERPQERETIYVNYT